MSDTVAAAGQVYQLRVVLAGISPLIWRRLLVAETATLADLHAVLQTSFGWSDEHLHRFIVHGVEYALPRDGAGWHRDARTVTLAGFGLRQGERLVYEYDFYDAWRHDIRLEQTAAVVPGRCYPVCTGGARTAPPEDCDGAWAFLALRQQHPVPVVTARLAELLAPLMDAPADAVVGELVGQHRQEMATLVRWARIDDFDRAGLNRALASLPTGPAEGTS
ncbi:MAG: plasmid pRiA4b ORF-3 family protein [Kineosporiaceae bacterium]